MPPLISQENPTVRSRPPSQNTDGSNGNRPGDSSSKVTWLKNRFVPGRKRSRAKKEKVDSGVLVHRHKLGFLKFTANLVLAPIGKAYKPACLYIKEFGSNPNAPTGCELNSEPGFRCHLRWEGETPIVIPHDESTNTHSSTDSTNTLKKRNSPANLSAKEARIPVAEEVIIPVAEESGDQKEPPLQQKRKLSENEDKVEITELVNKKQRNKYQRSQEPLKGKVVCHLG